LLCPAHSRSKPPREPPAPRPRTIVGGGAGRDPAPLTSRQFRALGGAVVRELAWGLPLAVLELRRWRARALHIPVDAVRDVALLALDHKRGNTHGAALFSVIPRGRSRPLLRLLTTYQVLWDFLDSLSEAWQGLTPDDTRHLHLALVDAVNPAGPIRDYYGRIAFPDDGGYLRSLVEASRDCCRALPSFHKVAPVLHEEARRIGVQAINHAPESAQIPLALRDWVTTEYLGTYEVAWFELAAAAGANLAVYALFALAAETSCPSDRVENTYRAYFPWTGALATMLDGFVDQFDDAQHGEHRYIAYYQSPEDATNQISRLVRRCLSETHALENGERHTLIAASMVAMYLSRDSARTPPLSAASQQLAQAGGSLTRTLLPVLRLWRVANRTSAS
jgi:tetraprenyl-beta-curcumene synthase